MAEISLDFDTEELADDYDDLSDPQYEEGKFLLGLMGIVRGPFRVLDIGSGTGPLTAYAADLVGPDGIALGIEPLAKRVAIATRKRVRPNLSFLEGNALNLSPFGVGIYDYAYFNAVLHWLAKEVDKLQALSEAANSLKQGGRIGILTASDEYPQPHREVRDRALSELYPDYQATTVKLPTWSELEGFLKRKFRIDMIVLKRVVVEAEDGKAMYKLVEASSFGNFVNNLRLTEEQKAAVRKVIVNIFDTEYRPDGGKVRFELMWLYTVSTKI